MGVVPARFTQTPVGLSHPPRGRSGALCAPVGPVKRGPPTGTAAGEPFAWRELRLELHSTYDSPVPDPEPDPTLNADERTTLSGFLDDQRKVLAWKCQGLSEAQLKEASVPPSQLTLLGLVRHMAENERSWFRRGLSGEDIGAIWCTDADPDAEFEGVPGADVAQAFSVWEEECRISRSILKELSSLDVTFGAPTRPAISARHMVNHMIEEYSRHNGHADLIRERLDAATGDFPS